MDLFLLISKLQSKNVLQNVKQWEKKVRVVERESVHNYDIQDCSIAGRLVHHLSKSKSAVQYWCNIHPIPVRTKDYGATWVFTR